MSAERVQKLLARAGVTSRRKAEELVREGRVTINGRVAGIGDKADLAVDSVKVDGKRLRPLAQHRYLLLNKPKGYLTAVQDEKGRPTVLDLVPPPLRNALFPVGRLDFQTEGLLLLTTDGEFAERVAHPRHGCSKVYEVKVHGVPVEAEIDRLRRGVVLDGKRTAPARITSLGRTGRGEEEGNSWWEVQLQEGRTRQIREMFFRIGHRVQKLRRVAIGPVRDPAIPLGALRDLDEREIDLLRRAADPALSPPSGRPCHPARALGRPLARLRRRSRAGPPPAARDAARSGSGPRRHAPQPDLAGSVRPLPGPVAHPGATRRPPPTPARPAAGPAVPAAPPSAPSAPSVSARGLDVPAAPRGPLVVAIDGPSGVGKSTTARGLARRLGIPYLDTGAMYRALALLVLRRGLDPGDREAVEALAASAPLGMRQRDDGQLEVLLDGEPVAGRIRAPEVSEATSRIAVYPRVRARMVALQREIAGREGGVLEGRDIGSQVLPGARFKFFLDAPLAVRVARRRLELAARGGAVDEAELAREIEERDRRDRARADSPLICTPGHIRIDTGPLDAEGVIARMLAFIRAGGRGAPEGA
ncbi:MAG: (d)CMP kinase [Thermoanaerobaculia bacterium]|nr:(d)CMP kinase [Thermoanaerobaculia bacterium]